ncbi:MAG: DUF2490 domain-containing protein [Porphyrobacter sp.]|nr:DUF2490 domain-containing protein [Porphyrobacter sp.]
MPITPARIAMLLAALGCAWQPSSALAADEDAQFWLTGFARGNLGEDVFLVIDTSLRACSARIGPDQQTIRVTVEQGFADNTLRLGGGFAVFETGGQTEFRPHQQLRFIKGGWDVRTRFEQRMFPGADRTELRIRQRVQYSHEASEKVKLIGSAEWFGVLQARSRMRDPDGTEQVRFLVAVAADVGGGFEIQPGYLLWYSPRAARADGISHVPQVAVNYRF